MGFASTSRRNMAAGMAQRKVRFEAGGSGHDGHDTSR